ncbi:MAG: DnaJ domain-containing protein [Deltaproteobacteria bacterium]|nr:DnaJ domain-containing protein [Deltaproteobacteria bacterium]MCB9785548.1 DnaJ domain-containing protein [Deltaproteobacteria bacterium]
MNTPIERPDYYAVLGVPRGADALTIRRAYRQLAASYHPDRHPGGSPLATVRFQRVVEAFGILGDPERRERYDAGQAIDAPKVEEGTALAELFGSVVDQLFGVKARSLQPGPDVLYRLDLEFAEAALGTRRELSLPRPDPCARCDGRGFPLEHLPEICPRCAGRGEIQRRRGLRSAVEACPDCDGRGHLVVVACEACEGRGRVEVRRPLRIDVPPGVADGAELLIRGAGGAGRHGGPPGDCIVRLTVRPHPLLRRRGMDVLLERPVRVFDAMAGGWLDVPTLEGPRRLRLAPNTGDGAVLRMSGLGVAATGGARGDQLVTIRLEWPTGLSAEQAAALEALARQSGPETFPRTARFEAAVQSAPDEGERQDGRRA